MATEKPPPILLLSTGVFLRGYGSRTATVDQGLMVSPRQQTFESGSVGEVQGDATRFWFSKIGTVVRAYRDEYDDTLRAPSIPSEYAPDGRSNWRLWVHGNSIVGANGIDKFSKDCFILTSPPKKYTLSGSGGQYAHYSLNEYSDNNGFPFFLWAGLTVVAPYSIPVASENRPVNVAVRYFIKAR